MLIIYKGTAIKWIFLRNKFPFNIPIALEKNRKKMKAHTHVRAFVYKRKIENKKISFKQNLV